MKMRRVGICSAAFAAVLGLAAATQVRAVPIIPQDILVYRVGDGSGTLTANTTPIFIDEYSPAGTLVQSLVVPTSGATAVTASGNSTTEGTMSLSTNGQYLVFSGYRKDSGLATPVSDASTTTPRVVARMDLNGAIDSTTALTDAFSAGNIRSVTSTDGTKFWISGSANAPRYVGSLGATTSSQIDTKNARQILVGGPDLYLTTGAGTRGLAQYTGLPTTTATPTFIVTLAAADAAHGLYLADLNAGVAGIDTVYLLDTIAFTLNKYSLVGGSWVANGTIASSSTTTNLTGTSNNGTTVSLYSTSPTTLSVFTDLAGYNATITPGSFTPIATAGTNTAFRGLAFVPEPASIALLGLAVPLLLVRRRSR